MTNFQVKSSQKGTLTVTRLDGSKRDYMATSTSTGTGITFEKALENASRAGASHLIRILYEEATKQVIESKNYNPVVNTSVLMSTIEHSA